MIARFTGLVTLQQMLIYCLFIACGWRARAGYNDARISPSGDAILAYSYQLLKTVAYVWCD